MLPRKNLKVPKRFSMDASLLKNGFMSALQRNSANLGLDTSIFPLLPVIPIKENLSFDDGDCTSKKFSQSDTHNKIKFIFDNLCTDTSEITTKMLENCLSQIGEDPHHAIDMIELLDHDNKGYVSEQEFALFFLKKEKTEKSTQLPLRMRKKAELVRFISENSSQLKYLQDERMCQCVMNEFKNIQAQKHNDE